MNRTAVDCGASTVLFFRGQPIDIRQYLGERAHLLRRASPPVAPGAGLLPARRRADSPDLGSAAPRHRAQPAQALAPGAPRRQHPGEQAVPWLAARAGADLGTARPAHRHHRGVAGAPSGARRRVRRARVPLDRGGAPRPAAGPRRRLRLAPAPLAALSPRHRGGGHHLPGRDGHVRLSRSCSSRGC